MSRGKGEKQWKGGKPVIGSGVPQSSIFGPVLFGVYLQSVTAREIVIFNLFCSSLWLNGKNISVKIILIIQQTRFYPLFLFVS